MLLSVVYHSPVVSLVSPGVTKLGKQALWNYKMMYWRYEFIVETRRCAVILFEVVILSHVSVVWFAVHRGCLITQRGWPSPTDCGRSCPAEAGVIPSELHWLRRTYQRLFCRLFAPSTHLFLPQSVTSIQTFFTRKDLQSVPQLTVQQK